MTIKQIILQKKIPFEVALPNEGTISKETKNVAASMAMEGMLLSDEEQRELDDYCAEECGGSGKKVYY